MTGLQRVQWPFLIHFGIDAPVDLRPFAALDFGRVAGSQTASVLTTLAGDQNHPDLRFLDVTSSDPYLDVELEPADGHTVLRARCRPGEPGNYRAIVSVGTSLPGYRIDLAATWKVVPDLEATPLDRIAFRARLDEAQEQGFERRQFVLVTDHDSRRSPEFSVHRVVDLADHDASSHFAITIEPVPGNDRQQRLMVRYLGGLSAAFRGKIVLTKDGQGGPFLPIDVAVFPDQHP
jgi:hypothetical protein